MVFAYIITKSVDSKRKNFIRATILFHVFSFEGYITKKKSITIPLLGTHQVSSMNANTHNEIHNNKNNIIFKL